MQHINWLGGSAMSVVTVAMLWVMSRGVWRRIPWTAVATRLLAKRRKTDRFNC